MNSPVAGLVEHLFRRQAGRLVAALTGALGPRHLQLCEEVVQEALLRALELWPFHGVPENPPAWLMRVAKNLALDRLRREAVLESKAAELERHIAMRGEGSSFADDQLAMMYLCCHPELSREARVALTLKVVAGFSVEEIARAFLCKPETIAQRVVRAKRQIREQNLRLELPQGAALGARTDSVLESIYFVFNEGYAATVGTQWMRLDLAEEAIYLTRLLAGEEAIRSPKIDALLALELLQAARFAARTDTAGDLLPLEEQDRSKWDRRLIAEGFHFFAQSIGGEELSEYHVQAAIAATHARAASLEATDWHAIVRCYEQLQSLQPSPVVRLNQAVAIAHRDGPAAGLAALREVEHHPALARYTLLPAVLAWTYQQLGEVELARAQYERALRLCGNGVEQRFLVRRLGALNG